MSSRQTQSARPTLPFNLEEVIASYTPSGQARIRSSVQQLNAGVPVNTVLRDLEQELVGPVVMSIIEGAIVSNVSADGLLRHLGMSDMTEEETLEFGYASESRASDGLVPPDASTTSLSRYLRSIVPGQLPQAVVAQANTHSLEEQTLIRRGLSRLQVGAPVDVMVSEPRSDMISNIIAMLIEHSLDGGATLERTLSRMGVPPFTLSELERLCSAPRHSTGDGGAGAKP